MENAEVAEVFHEIADLLTIHGGNPHRIRSFSRTARVIETLPERTDVMLRFGTLQKVPGLGDGSVRRIKDILRTGTCDEHLKLRRELPGGLRDMLDIRGLGPRTIRILFSNLRIGSISELEVAIRAGKVQGLPRIGQRTAEKLLQGIEDWKTRIGKVPWVDARRSVQRIVDQLDGTPHVQRILIGGSVRRGKAEIGDLDILVGADDKLAVASRFLTLPEVDEVLVHGEGRASVRLHNRQQVDLRVLDVETFGAGTHYFTGSKLHNIAIRARGLKLFDRKISDKGIFDRHTEVRLAPGREEEEIFQAVGLPYIAPELRENTGEIEAAEQGRLPRLVTAGDLMGDLHMHTVASDGRGSVADMVQAAHKIGHAYIAITDHTKTLGIANGLDERRLTAQVGHVRDTEQQLGLLHVLAGTEVDILPDGRLDLDASVLRGLDWVVASIHTGLEMTGAAITDRYIAAMETGLVDCIGHPETRRLGHRKSVPLDMERLLKAARRLDVALEINGNPYRMDLSDVGARQAKEAGVLLCIDTDAHAPGHLVYQEFGLITARRGWIEAHDVLNARPVEVLRDLRRSRLRSHGIAVTGWERPVDPQALAEVTHPDALIVAEHWPEGLDRPVEPTVPASEVAPADPDLAERLAAPLDDALRARIETYLRSGGDPALEAALLTRGDNAMQVAFNLLSA